MRAYCHTARMPGFSRAFGLTKFALKYSSKSFINVCHSIRSIRPALLLTLNSNLNLMNAVILRISRVKDTDAIVDWLTDENQIITTYAARVQSSSSFPNGLELMNIYEIEFSLKPMQDMGRLTSAVSVEQFTHIITDMPAYACACAALEAVSDVCPKDNPVIDLFQNLLAALAVMNTAHELASTVLAWFECFMLNQMGAMPNLDMCANCAEPLKKSSWFQQELGFLCPTCAHQQSNIPSFVLEAIRKLRDQSIRTTVQNALSHRDEAMRKRILTPVLKFLTAVLCDNSPVKRLKAHRFMAETALGCTDFIHET